MRLKKVGPIVMSMVVIAILLSVFSYSDNGINGIKKIKTGVIKAVVLGDSIALSARATNPSKTGWTANLDSDLKNAFPLGEVKWTLLALNGSGVDYAIQRSSELTQDADVVYICTGRNDAKRYLYDAFKLKYTELIKAVKRKAPQADILCIIEPPMVSADDTMFNTTRKAILDTVQETHVLVVDTWAQFPKENSQLSSFLYDGLHPNDSGYRIISQCILNTMRTKIEEE